MFGTQAMRLRRTDWKNATLLAEELYAMFQEDIPLTHSGGLELKAKGDDAPLTLTRGEFSDGPVLTFNNGGGDTGGFAWDGADLVISGPSIFFETLDGEGNPVRTALGEGSGGGDEEEEETPASSYPGQVVSGEGTAYRVNVYTAGTSGTPTEVSAVGLGVADEAQVAAGSWHMVSAVPDARGVTRYFFAPAVWS